MPVPPPKKSKMEEAIENARKPDCRTAYASMGLLAVVPLVANEFGEGTAAGNPVHRIAIHALLKLQDL